jgi:hypothetical protein
MITHNQGNFSVCPVWTQRQHHKHISSPSGVQQQKHSGPVNVQNISDFQRTMTWRLRAWKKRHLFSFNRMEWMVSWWVIKSTLLVQKCVGIIGLGRWSASRTISPLWLHILGEVYSTIQYNINIDTCDMDLLFCSRDHLRLMYSLWDCFYCLLDFLSRLG